VIYRRGEIWIVQFSDPPEGGEQGYRRPGVIVSSDGMNDLPLDVVIVVPATSRRRANALTGKVPDNLIEVKPSSTNGLTEISYFMTEQVRAVSKSVRMKRKLGVMAVKDTKRLEAGLCLVMDLFP
jgi:mRNA-degrading endonuclease toxin of MazEF toxin-antitoxin module